MKMVTHQYQYYDYLYYHLNLKKNINLQHFIIQIKLNNFLPFKHMLPICLSKSSCFKYAVIFSTCCGINHILVPNCSKSVFTI